MAAQDVSQGLAERAIERTVIALQKLLSKQCCVMPQPFKFAILHTGRQGLTECHEGLSTLLKPNKIGCRCLILGHLQLYM